MDIVLGLWCAGIFFLAGLSVGKIKWGYVTENAEVTEEKTERKEPIANKRKNEKKAVPGEKRIPIGWAVGSPAVGKVSYFNEGSQRGAKILPEQGLIYAPVAGKITKIYPTGNAMRLRTDYGIELLVQAGIGTEELEGLYYRARVLKNEVVNKGKLLIEFDKDSIRKEGYDPSVVMTVEDSMDFRDIMVSDKSRVKAGEEIMWVRK